MKIDTNKLDYVLAKKCCTLSVLRKNLSPQTLTKVKNGCDVLPITVGKIAKALNVSIDEIIEKE